VARQSPQLKARVYFNTSTDREKQRYGKKNFFVVAVEHVSVDVFIRKALNAAHEALHSKTNRRDQSDVADHKGTAPLIKLEAHRLLFAVNIKICKVR
jgi:hypothetical protein